MHYNSTASAAALARKLIRLRHLDTDEYRQLIEERDEESARMLAEEAVRIRILHPPVLLPATTALGTILPGGREKGILSGANVFMPNLSPKAVRSKYSLYNNKLSTGAESAQHIRDLDMSMRAIGYRICVDRGDIRKAK